jgi:hypothetical protein
MDTSASQGYKHNLCFQLLEEETLMQ